MVRLVRFCNLWISIQFLLKICFVLAVCLSLVSTVTICREKPKKLYVFGNGREPKVHKIFVRRGVVCSIGHQTWVPALKFQDEKRCRPGLILCVGTKAPSTFQAMMVASVVGSLAVQWLMCDKLRVQAQAWLELMTWDTIAPWPSRPLVRSLWQIMTMRGWLASTTDLDGWCLMSSMKRIFCVARPTTCCTCWLAKLCRSWRARGSRQSWPLRVFRKTPGSLLPCLWPRKRWSMSWITWTVGFYASIQLSRNLLWWDRTNPSRGCPRPSRPVCHWKRNSLCGRQ